MFTLLKGRPVQIGLPVDLSDCEININSPRIRSLNLSIARNRKENYQAALKIVINLVERTEKVIAIVHVYERSLVYSILIICF